MCCWLWQRLVCESNNRTHYWTREHRKRRHQAVRLDGRMGRPTASWLDTGLLSARCGSGLLVSHAPRKTTYRHKNSIWAVHLRRRLERISYSHSLIGNPGSTTRMSGASGTTCQCCGPQHPTDLATGAGGQLSGSTGTTWQCCGPQHPPTWPPASTANRVLPPAPPRSVAARNTKRSGHRR